VYELTQPLTFENAEVDYVCCKLKVSTASTQTGRLFEWTSDSPASPACSIHAGKRALPSPEP